MRTTYRLVLAAALALLPARLHAFDYQAHCRMSNRALRIAAIQVARDASPDRATRDSLLVLRAHTLAAACVDPGHRPRSYAYGEWVAQVDWATNPADFFVTPVFGAANGWTPPDTVPVDAIFADANLPLQDYRILHENAEHFGATALYLFGVWHRHAMDLARGGSLNTALVYQAFADHYLEDLFAPGHVFSPRRGLNDAFAGAVHNRYNRRGAWYAPEHTAQLARLLSDTAGVGDALTPSFAALASGACGAAALAECVSRLDRDSVPMFGDYQLDRSPAQELLVTLVIAQSLYDVLRAWAERGSGTAAPNSFAAVRWCGYRLDTGSSGARRPWTSPNVVLPFGRYRQERRSGLPENDYWPAFRAGYVNRLGRPGGDVELAVEKVFAGWPADWAGGIEPGRSRAFREDRTTFVGADLRIPAIGDRHGMGIGAYERFSSSFNRVNARLSYLYGARVYPQDRSVEPHVAMGGEIGFAVLHAEFRPSAAYNSRHGWEAGMLTGVSVVYPLSGKKQPRRPMLPPGAGPGAEPCE